EDLVVARPPDALTLRAIGGDVDGVAAEAPVRDVVEPVEVLVTATKTTGSLEVRVDHLHPDGSGGDGHVVPGDPGILEAVDRVPRLEGGTIDAEGDDVVPLVQDDEPVTLAFRVQMRHVEVPVRIEMLAVLDHRPGATGAEVRQA